MNPGRHGHALGLLRGPVHDAGMETRSAFALKLPFLAITDFLGIAARYGRLPPP